jgi:hypothetical protein
LTTTWEIRVFQFLIGKLKTSRTVLLSSDTLAKQRRDHPEIPNALYRAVQGVIDEAFLVVQDLDTTLVFVDRQEHLIHIALKATRRGDGLYITSLRYTNEADVQRIRRRGQIVRERPRN